MGHSLYLPLIIIRSIFNPPLITQNSILIFLISFVSVFPEVLYIPKMSIQGANFLETLNRHEIVFTKKGQLRQTYFRC
jgi:hypothetical protein